MPFFQDLCEIRITELFKSILFIRSIPLIYNIMESDTTTRAVYSANGKLTYGDRSHWPANIPGLEISDQPYSMTVQIPGAKVNPIPFPRKEEVVEKTPKADSESQTRTEYVRGYRIYKEHVWNVPEYIPEYINDQPHSMLFYIGGRKVTPIPFTTKEEVAEETPKKDSKPQDLLKDFIDYK
jgi:hypothetical protein